MACSRDTDQPDHNNFSAMSQYHGFSGACVACTEYEIKKISTQKKKKKKKKKRKRKRKRKTKNSKDLTIQAGFSTLSTEEMGMICCQPGNIKIDQP